MAGVTSAPLRRMCFEAGAAACVGEMLLAHELVAGNRRTRHLARFHESEALRSAQLYAVDPRMAAAAARLLADAGVHHIDLNFGCSVRKVTARGGGAALPLRPRLFRALVAAAVEGAGGRAAVTVKMRIGVSRRAAELNYFLEAGAIAEEEGVAGITLHARTADQLYAPHADWGAVRALVSAVRVPVIGNGDVFEAADAIQMIRETGCAGVMVGRGCLGRPWLFSEAAVALSGDPSRWPPPPPPALGEIVRVALRHASDLADWEGDERSAVLQMRKLVGCYLLGFEKPDLKARLYAAQSLADWRAAAAAYADDATPFPAAALRAPRLKGGGADGRPAAQKVSLPAGWLEGRDEESVPEGLTGEACEG
ncbi:MAG: dihydrouridine synthase-domain-containing protein [Monoraphidium minutum]|nr:MAG: dihydrouridine synthase-domain-containing protein [Monoraphidium minutum]